jgi:alkylhydroperoxidase family enzyme
MARIDLPDEDGPEVSRIWKLNPAMAKGVGALGRAVYQHTTISVREREVARMRVAQLNRCDV